MHSSVMRKEARFRAIIVQGITIVLSLAVLPILVSYVRRIGYRLPIDYNEGWNAIHTARLLRGEPLYLGLSDLPIAPVNYPPLSFFFVGALGYFTDQLLITGRVLSLGALLLVAWLIYKTIFHSTSSRPSAIMGALLWIAMVIQNASNFVGMYDPQLLAHVFSTGALFLSIKWRDQPDRGQLWIIAGFCSIALFFKHMVVAVPLTLAIMFLLKDRKIFWHFALAGVTTTLVLFFSCWIYGGEYFLSNFIELERSTSHIRRLNSAFKLFFQYSWWVLFVPFLIAGMTFRKVRSSVRLYFIVALILGFYFAGGVGVSKNSWFDFFIASALTFGLVIGNHPLVLRPPPWPVVSGVMLIAASLSINIYFYLGTDGASALTAFSLRCLQFLTMTFGIMSILRQRLAGVVGAALATVGIAVNEVLVGQYLSSDGVLHPSTMAALRSQQLWLITGGIALLGRRWILALAERLFSRLPRRLSLDTSIFKTWAACSAVYGILLLGAMPILLDLSMHLRLIPRYSQLLGLAHAYQRDVELLRSIPGPALFEDLLLGFDAGKELFFDPFAGAVLISSGRVPEEVLLEPIAEKSFAVIVMKSDLAQRLAEQRRRQSKAMTPEGVLNGTILEVIQEHYELLDTGGDPENYFFYVPKPTR